MNHADHLYIRKCKLFREFYIIEVGFIISTRRVEKVGEREKYTELLIANYPLRYQYQAGRTTVYGKYFYWKV